MEPAFVCRHLSKTDIQICLTCCSVDVVLGVLVLHWITSVRNEPRAASPPAIECAIHGNNAVDCCLISRPRDIRCTDQHIIRRACLKAKSITDQIRAPSKAHSSGNAKPQTPPGENLVVVSYEVWTTVEEAAAMGTTSKTIGETENNFEASNDFAEASNNSAGETLDNSD